MAMSMALMSFSQTTDPKSLRLLFVRGFHFCEHLFSLHRVCLAYSSPLLHLLNLSILILLIKTLLLIFHSYLGPATCSTRQRTASFAGALRQRAVFCVRNVFWRIQPDHRVL